MYCLIKFSVILLATSFVFIASPIAAQEEATNSDEVVSAQDLGIAEPKVLPDSPFYFLKNWSRGIQTALTFRNEEKIELKQRFANEKLLEVRKLTEKGKNSQLVEKAAENYKKEVDKIKNLAEKIKTKAESNERINKFLDKYTQQQALHQKILQKLENQVPPSTLEKIKQTRQTHLERFKDVMLKLENKDKIPERLEKNLEALKGSEFKEFKNLEIMKVLEEKMPQEIRIKIEEKRNNIVEKFRVKLENLPTSSQERFKNYLEKSGGDKTRQLEILNNLKIQKIPEGIKNIIKRAEEVRIKTPSENKGPGNLEKRQAAPENVKVEIKNFRFIPERVVVKAGGIITFTNADNVIHNITIDGKVVVPNLKNSESGTYQTDPEKKTINYICGLHPRMKGKIEIIAAE